MLIGGVHRFSLIDYPEKTACVVFSQGCNLRCPYCHNPELIKMDSLRQRVLEKAFFDFLISRQGKLDAVVITGGEPCLQSDLEDFIAKIKELDFLVKLDTNGTNAEVLERLLAKHLLNYIAMDIKAPLMRYEEVTGVNFTKAKIKQIQHSIELVLTSPIPYEFRTTVVAGLLTSNDVLAIGDLIRQARLYVLQRFHPAKTYQPEFATSSSFSEEEFQQLTKALKAKGIHEVLVR